MEKNYDSPLSLSITQLPDPTSQFLAFLPPFIDSWDAVAAALASGDQDRAWRLVRANKLMTVRLRAEYERALAHYEEVRLDLNELQR